MLEKIFWGIASLSKQNFNEYLDKESKSVNCQNFSFFVQDETLFIRSNFPTLKNMIRYQNFQNKTVSGSQKQLYSHHIEITKTTYSVKMYSDIFGIHSIYWSKLNNGIIFSNSSYFLAILLGKSPLGIEGLFMHLILRGQPNNTSYFNDIFQLPPQSILSVDASGINILKRELNASPSASISELLLKNIPADVAASSGICFSGGIDSSVIVKECLGKYKNIACYSLVNPNNENLMTDLFFADKLASQQHFNINKVFFKIDKEIFYYDMPVLDHDVYGQHCLAQAMIHDRKRFMICGSGADELFGGYDRIFYYAHELGLQKGINPLDCILQRYSYTDFHLLQNISKDLFTDVYHKIKAYYQNITDSSCDPVTQLHYWFIYHHLFWILKMHPNDLVCIFPFLREEFLSFCLRTDSKDIFPYIMVEPGDSSYHAKVKSIIKQQYIHSLPAEILNRPKLPFSVQEAEINQWYELQYAEKQPDCLIPDKIFADIMAEKYGSQTKLLFLSYILWRQRVS